MTSDQTPSHVIKGSEPTKKRRKVKIGHSGNVEFERIEPADLGSVPVMVQALDNQWIPRSNLHSVMQKGYLTERVEKHRRKFVRAEYIRALINGQQVILNRAYLFNNRAVSQDYFQKGEKREAFKALLEKGVIIPYLLTEDAPVDPPSSGFGTDSSFDPDPRVTKWREVCQEVRMRCVRLSWDDKENWESARQQLSERFNKFVASASMGDIEQYLHDLGLDSSAESGLRKRLVEMGRLCQDFREQNKYITREALYKAFITGGRSSVEGKYDITSPFVGDIKQLIDLNYNCNLPDALGGYLITPVDSLPRTALQEWQQAAKRPNITGEELLTLLQQMTFDLVGKALNIRSMDLLSLQDVREIRHMDEWAEYIQSLEALLANPLQFANGGAAKVYENYAKLTKLITNLVVKQDRKEKVLTSWEPAIELVFYIAGAVLSYLWTAEGATYQLLGQVSGTVSAVATPIVARLIIRDMSEKKAQQDFSTSIDFMKYKMVDAKKQWKEIERQVRKLPGFRELAVSLGEEEIVDPTFNYQEIEY